MAQPKKLFEIILHVIAFESVMFTTWASFNEHVFLFERGLFDILKNIHIFLMRLLHILYVETQIFQHVQNKIC